MKIMQASFVFASELFKDCDKAWCGFVEESSDCSWGDNEHSLVMCKTIALTLKNMIESAGDDPSQSILVADIERVLGRISLLPDGTLIDLEN